MGAGAAIRRCPRGPARRRPRGRRIVGVAPPLASSDASTVRVAPRAHTGMTACHRSYTRRRGRQAAVRSCGTNGRKRSPPLSVRSRVWFAFAATPPRITDKTDKTHRFGPQHGVLSVLSVVSSVPAITVPSTRSPPPTYRQAGIASAEDPEGLGESIAADHQPPGQAACCTELTYSPAVRVSQERTRARN